MLAMSVPSVVAQLCLNDVPTGQEAIACIGMFSHNIPSRVDALTLTRNYPPLLTKIKL